MIAYFPAPYPDELLYSQLARYYIASGYMAYTFAAEELFQFRTVRPSLEFVNQFTPDALQAITRNMPMEQIIEKHTMFPYYGRFLPKERRKKAYNALIAMEGNYHNLLPIPQRKDGKARYLRYCPLCAADDRKKHGETYWHRIHQMMGVRICPDHCCALVDSDVMFDGKASPSLKSAEEIIPPEETTIFSDNELECRAARYVSEVFQAEVDLESEVTAGQFLHSRMEGSKYLSVRGEQRNIALLHGDILEFYQDLPGNWFTELWQLQKVLADDRLNAYEICLIAMFLDISHHDLTHMELPEESQQQRFDEEIRRLHDQGLKYPAIAKTLNAPYDLVKSIGEGRYGTCRAEPKVPPKSASKSYDWRQIDEDTLPLVKAAIRQLQGDKTSRPKKVTITTVEKMLHLPCKQIRHYLPQCRAEIQRHEESQERYWAREVCWAAKEIIRNGKPLTWTAIYRLTNIRRRNFNACVPYLADYTDAWLLEQLSTLQKEGYR